MYSNYRTRPSKEPQVINRLVKHFRTSLKLGIPLEGDGDLPGIWVLATCHPRICAELMQEGIGDLFSPDVSLPTIETFSSSRKEGLVRFP